MRRAYLLKFPNFDFFFFFVMCSRFAFLNPSYANVSATLFRLDNLCQLGQLPSSLAEYPMLFEHYRNMNQKI